MASRRFLTIAALLLIAAAGAGYVFLGPSVLFGGPSKAEIVRVAREGMIAAAASPEEDAVARDARIAPQGYCSSAGGGAWACIVGVSLEGAQAGTFVALLKRNAEGEWAAP
ncbi:hypothetical protein G5B31_07095 [Rhodobacter sp. SGA-6-6]|uniref:hypothetical protein n=1 Tax=Rhodobacter sp. SGA-6-6 TaxID=2710882 RepID=UPI0013EDE53F|nr:hypothetical protein [Rhodobacter sp. SGA-6-6]NGM45300.1 hypothetical protein [Rhodobacter sp. SGA-6-6]